MLQTIPTALPSAKGPCFFIILNFIHLFLPIIKFNSFNMFLFLFMYFATPSNDLHPHKMMTRILLPAIVSPAKIVPTPFSRRRRRARVRRRRRATVRRRRRTRVLRRRKPRVMREAASMVDDFSFSNLQSTMYLQFMLCFRYYRYFVVCVIMLSM